MVLTQLKTKLIECWTRMVISLKLLSQVSHNLLLHNSKQKEFLILSTKTQMKCSLGLSGRTMSEMKVGSMTQAKSKMSIFGWIREWTSILLTSTEMTRPIKRSLSTGSIILSTWLSRATRSFNRMMLYFWCLKLNQNRNLKTWKLRQPKTILGTFNISEFSEWSSRWPSCLASKALKSARRRKLMTTSLDKKMKTIL